jgi:hypothetical protein
MAYGQTGAGKTYSLSSIAADAIGMIPRAAAEVFSHIEQDGGHEYSVYMSYVQLYMELIQVGCGIEPHQCLCEIQLDCMTSRSTSGVDVEGRCRLA